MLKKIEGTREKIACWTWSSRKDNLQGKPGGVHGCGDTVSESDSRDPAVRSAMPWGQDDVDELDESRTRSPPVESQISHEKCTEREIGVTVLCTSDVFCCLLGEGNPGRVPKPPLRIDDSRSGSSTSSGNEWQPCEFVLTKQVMHLTRRSPSEASTVTSVKAGTDRCLCTVSLAKIVDVATSVCIFGSMLDQDERTHHISTQAPIAPLAGITEDHATCPETGRRLDDRLAPAAERQRRLRKTSSKFNKILRRVPQSDLHSMLVKVGPYDFKERSPRSACAGNNGNRQRALHCPICDSVMTTGEKSVGYCERCSEERASSGVGSEPGEGCTTHGQDFDEKCPVDDALWEGAETCFEHLRNGVAVGTFELPPIPFASLPETKAGLPAKREAVKDPRQNRSHKARNFHSTHGGRPLCDYDESNCQPHMSLDCAIPPLPPSACRLPAATCREFDTEHQSNDVTLTMESSGSPHPNIIVVWTTSSASLAKCSGHTRRLQQGTPILLSFVREEDASTAYDALLKYRAQQLDEDNHRTGIGQAPAPYPASTVEATPKRLLPQFGAVAQTSIVGARTMKR